MILKIQVALFLGLLYHPLMAARKPFSYKRLTTWMIRNGCTDTELGQMFGVSRQAAAGWRKGTRQPERRRWPDLDDGARLLERLHSIRTLPHGS